MPSPDLSQLLTPVSEQEPAGPNLEYEPEFLDLERVAKGKPEQQMGSVIIPAEPPDYEQVLQKSVALLGRSKDLRAAVYLVDALLHRRGYEGLRDGFAFLQGLLEQFWPALHPELDPDDQDPFMRANALGALARPEVLLTLRGAPLVSSRSFGSVSLKQLQQASGEGTPDDEPPPDPATMEAVFQESSVETLSAVVQMLKEASGHVRSTEESFERLAGQRGPELTPITQLLRQATLAVEQRLSPRQEHAPSSLNIDAGPVGAAEASAPAAARRGPAAAPGEISSREDVVRALDKICEYYARHEPSSPLPLFLERCKRLVPLSFMDIIRDMAPDALSQVQTLAGKTD